jgi:hypothetical protein
MDALVGRVLVEMLVVLAGAALLRLLAWLGERSAGAPAMATTP